MSSELDIKCEAHTNVQIEPVLNLWTLNMDTEANSAISLLLSLLLDAHPSDSGRCGESC